MQFDDIAVNSYVRIVAVSKNLKITTTVSLNRAKNQNQENQKKQNQENPKKQNQKKKKNIIPVLFQNITSNMHKWKSSEILVFFFGFVFLFFLVFLGLVVSVL